MGAQPFVLDGGNDRLPRAMADELGDPIKYGVDVSAIADKGDAVHVKAIEQNTRRTFEADQVICTFPAKVLHKIQFDPKLPAEKQKAIKKMPYIDHTLTYLTVDKPYWKDRGVLGIAYTDLHVAQFKDIPVWKMPLAILESYRVGAKAKEAANLPKEQLIERTLKGIDKVHPGIPKYYKSSYIKSWGTDPYSLGGPSWPAPGDVTKYLEPLQQPHGNIRFGGEHTKILRSTMEGVLR